MPKIKITTLAYAIFSAIATALKADSFSKNDPVFAQKPLTLFFKFLKFYFCNQGGGKAELVFDKASSC